MNLSAHIYKFIPISLLASIPTYAYAQTPDFDTTIAAITKNLDNTIAFLILLATVVFLYGIVRYVTAGDDEKKVEAARNMIVYGIIFLAIMIAMWAFVNLVLTFIFTGVTTDSVPDIPLGPRGTPPT